MSYIFKNDAAYQRYLAAGRAGEQLPEYEKDAPGHLVIYRGEVFCRAGIGCDATKIWPRQCNLRTHLNRHFKNDNTVVWHSMRDQTFKSGSPSMQEHAVALSWFRKHFPAPAVAGDATSNTNTQFALPAQLHGHSVAVQTASQQRGSTGAGSRSLTSSFAIAQDPEDGQYTIKVESDDGSSWEGFPDSENENIFMDKYESGS